MFLETELWFTSSTLKCNESLLLIDFGIIKMVKQVSIETRYLLTLHGSISVGFPCLCYLQNTFSHGSSEKPSLSGADQHYPIFCMCSPSVPVWCHLVLGLQVPQGIDYPGTYLCTEACSVQSWLWWRLFDDDSTYKCLTYHGAVSSHTYHEIYVLLA